jgi:hypothetical protein
MIGCRWDLIVPNTLHCLLHAATAATLLLLAVTALR